MDKSENKSGIWILIGVIVGALIGEIGFFIFFAIFSRLFGFLFIQRELGTSSTDTMVLGYFLVIFILPFGLGAFGGLAGAYLARKRYKRLGPWVGASIGGLLVAMIAAFLVQFLFFSILW